MRSPLISIIVPIGPEEESWAPLMSDLSFLAKSDISFEIIFCCCEEGKTFFEMPFASTVYSERGRGKQMNKGAEVASGRFLWFLHADSRLEKVDFFKLMGSLSDYPERLHYFDLSFLEDGPLFMGLNALGVKLRSDILGIPFGDQGFCLSQDLFWELGGLSENDFGEDHLFLWKARQMGIKLENTRGRIVTSSRKYREKGWLKTTLFHLFLTAKVAIPRWLQTFDS